MKSNGPRAKRFTALAVAGSAGHNGFERWAGIGVFLEPWLGRRATNLLWAITLPLSFLQAIRPNKRDEPVLAFNGGIAVAGAAVHYIEWPWSRRLGFIPWLDDAEGLPKEMLLPYNLILLGWLIGGLGSIARETKREDLKWAALGVASTPLLLASARHHFAWAREQAKRDPTRWNPALCEVSPSARIRAKEAAQ
jgi:hypothetical protein